MAYVAKKSTGLTSSLRLLYANYGGWRSLFSSEYFFLSLILAGLCWRYAITDQWSELAKSILPTLSGFSIAAYAIFFAVLDERTREALRVPAPELDNRSPLMILASAISHAVAIQLLGLILAIIYLAKPLPTLDCLEMAAKITNVTFSAVGLLVTMYGIVLIMASILAIYRILEIRSRAK